MSDAAPPSSDDGTLTLPVSSPNHESVGLGSSCWHLVVLWSEDEPERVGECCAVPRSALLGRGPTTESGDPPKLEFSRLRPGLNEPTGALAARALSRRQLRLVPDGDALKVENLGRRGLLHNGLPTTACRAKVDDTLAVDGVALFAVVKRTRLLAASAREGLSFGEADADGIVGETPQAFALRNELRRVALAAGHVLILGESGSGKELCAQALHRHSQSGGALVSRSAATIPASLVEAELFGQAGGYPNAGAPPRQGLFGLAHGGTLFLDEIAELGEAQQANLLRVLDAGEYQRLGEDKVRRSNVRVVGATNRPLHTLKPELLARFPERLLVPSLDARRADIPLLVRHLLRRLAAPGSPLTNCRPTLIDALVRHRYTLNFRELERLVRLAIKGAEGSAPGLTDELRAELDLPTVNEPDASQVREVLAASANLSEAAQRLGLPNRWALGRLVKRLGIDSGDRG